MSADHRTAPTPGNSTITTTETTTTVVLAARTRDVLIRGLHADLMDPRSARNLRGLLPPQLADDAAEQEEDVAALRDSGVRNAARLNARLYATIADLIVSREVVLAGGLHRFRDLEAIVSSGRAEIGRQLATAPPEQTDAIEVLVDLDRIQRHATAMRNATGTGATSIELVTAPSMPTDRDLVALLGSLDDRLSTIELRIGWVSDRIGVGCDDVSLSEASDRLWDDVACLGRDQLRRDRLILAAVEGQAAPQPDAHPSPHVEDLQYDLDYVEVLTRRSTAEAAQALVAGGGVLPVTIGPDGERRR